MPNVIVIPDAALSRYRFNRIADAESVVVDRLKDGRWVIPIASLRLALDILQNERKDLVLRITLAALRNIRDELQTFDRLDVTRDDFPDDP